MRWIGVAAIVLSSVAQAQLSEAAPSPGPVVEPAQIDNAMLFVVSNRVSAITPTCTVEVWALWEPGGVEFGGVAFDLYANPDAGGFSDPERLLTGPGTQDGEVAPDGDSVVGITSGRLCFPFDPPCDFVPCPNPEAVWRVTWSTDDSAPRVVDLSTLTSIFEVYMNKDCISQSFLDELVEGAGQIVVSCYADCDQSTGLGVLDLFDFLCFVNAFNAASPDANCDGDDTLSLFDFLCFTNEFNAGC